MGKIIVLDELTINQIAAGEVIERPASVVKELVENSIDAGANKISIDIQNGGINKIRVMDNGYGIDKDDIDFVFERHATSKIKKADDLETVKSMGFRGEALASIAAISNVELISKTENDKSGNRIVVEGENVLEKGEFASQKGTTITVSNLFFNTPVRYKFLKKDFTEAGYIEDVVTRIAFANPDVAIKLTNGVKTIIQTNGDGKIENVLYNIYGKEVVEGSLPVQYEYEGIKITGMVGKPEIARGNRTYQMFFVNKRYVKDKILSAAVEQAFKGLLTVGKYGFLVLNINVDPKKVDVNVHPTKLEVRWVEEQKVFKAVYYAVKEALLKNNLIPSPEKITEKEKNTEGLNKNGGTQDIKENEENLETKTIKMPNFINIFRKKENKLKEDIAPTNSANTIQELYNNRSHIKEQGEEKQDEFKLPTEEQVSKMNDILKMQKNMGGRVDRVQETSEKFDEMYIKTFGKSLEAEKNENKKSDINLESIENISVFESSNQDSELANYKYIGSLFSTYIVIEIKDEIYIIDQHAAHERIMYEKIKKNFYSNSNTDSQIMLLPDIITLSNKEKEIVKENAELFEKTGFMLEAFGENTVKLIGVPSLCMELDTKELFLQLLDEIGTVAITATQEKEEKFISTLACKAAVKANMKLEKEEIDKLLFGLLKLPNPFTCPHGRPTAIKISKSELEHKFSRK